MNYLLGTGSLAGEGEAVLPYSIFSLFLFLYFISLLL